MTKAPLFSACLCFILALACSDEHDGYDRGVRPPTSPAASGTLELSWSIEGRQDAAICQEVAAVAFETVLYDQGFGLGRWRAPCADFETSVDIYVDDFVARSTLVDINGARVGRRTVEDSFVIAEGQVTRLVMDFPLASSPMPPDDTPDGGATPVTDAGAPPASDADAATGGAI